MHNWGYIFWSGRVKNFLKWPPSYQLKNHVLNNMIYCLLLNTQKWKNHVCKIQQFMTEMKLFIDFMLIFELELFVYVSVWTLFFKNVTVCSTSFHTVQNFVRRSVPLACGGRCNWRIWRFQSVCMTVQENNSNFQDLIFIHKAKTETQKNVVLWSSNN